MESGPTPSFAGPQTAANECASAGGRGRNSGRPRAGAVPTTRRLQCRFVKGSKRALLPGRGRCRKALGLRRETKPRGQHPLSARSTALRARDATSRGLPLLSETSWYSPKRSSADVVVAVSRRRSRTVRIRDASAPRPAGRVGTGIAHEEDDGNGLVVDDRPRSVDCRRCRRAPSSIRRDSDAGGGRPRPLPPAVLGQPSTRWPRPSRWTSGGQRPSAWARDEKQQPLNTAVAAPSPKQ